MSVLTRSCGFVFIVGLLLSVLALANNFVDDFTTEWAKLQGLRGVKNDDLIRNSAMELATLCNQLDNTFDQTEVLQIREKVKVRYSVLLILIGKGIRENRFIFGIKKLFHWIGFLDSSEVKYAQVEAMYEGIAATGRKSLYRINLKDLIERDLSSVLPKIMKDKELNITEQAIERAKEVLWRTMS